MRCCVLDQCVCCPKQREHRKRWQRECRKRWQRERWKRWQRSEQRQRQWSCGFLQREEVQLKVWHRDLARNIQAFARFLTRN
jgi:hypothetical protein